VSDKLVTRQVVDDLLAYKQLDGVEAALHAVLDTLVGGDEQRGDPAALLAAIGDAVPVTVVWGRQDQIIPAEQAQAVAGAVRYVIEGAGHEAGAPTPPARRAPDDGGRGGGSAR
jgi:pyruvate dehydrogenase E2 component (dihydrolipoamide acetyltransferase)